MIYRKSYNQLSQEFLQQNHDIVLQDVFHHIQAHLLFPLSFNCHENRQKAILSMNMGFYNKAIENQVEPDRINAIKKIFDLPDDSYFKSHYEDCYPLWLIKEELKEHEEQKHFRIVNRLCWTLLRSSKSHQHLGFQPQASIKDAVNLIMGKMPLKSKNNVMKMEHLCSEKVYGRMLKRYMSVCHFILAHEHMRGDYADGWYGGKALSFTPNNQIARFLSLSHWFRAELRKPIRTNVKEPELFPERHLISLPLWVNSGDIDIPIPPIEEKVREIDASIVYFGEEEMRARREKYELRREQKRLEKLALAKQRASSN